MKLLVIASLAACGALAGCGGSKSSESNLKLESEVQQLATKVKELETDLANLQRQQFDMLLEMPQTTATFDPQEEKKYISLKAPAGTILAVLEKVEPYLDGYTVSIRLGNPSTASYSGMKGQVQWGRKRDFSKSAEFNKMAEKKIDLPDSIPSGRWTFVKFNIAPAAPDQVRRIVFEPSFDSLSLAR